MKETKRRMEFFSLYDHTNIEKHLEKMALKGWMIESIGSYFWKYQKTEPQKLRFSVVYYPKTVNEGTVISADRQHFIDMCTSGGWEYVINQGQMHIFCTKDENIPPIETDPEIQIECIHKFAKHEIIYSYCFVATVFLLLFAAFIYRMWKEPVEATGNQLYRIWYAPFIVGFSICNIVKYLSWYKEAKIAAENGEFTDTKRLIKIEVLLWTPIYLFSAILEFFSFMRIRYILFTLGLFVLAILLFYLFKKIRSVIYKSERENKTKIRTKNIIAISLVIVYIALGILGYIIIPKPYTHVREHTDGIFLKTYNIYHDDDAPLDISDFTDISRNTISREKHIDESVLIKQSSWTIYSIEEDDNLYLNYEITDVRFTPILERCKNELIYNHYIFDYKKINSSAECEVYRQYNRKGEEGNRFVFCDNSRIVEAHFGWEPSEDEILHAAEKLINADI